MPNRSVVRAVFFNGRLNLGWSSQDFVETSSRGFCVASNCSGTEPAEVTVTAGSIVERLDVVGQFGDRELSVLVDVLLDPVFLEATEKGLRDGHCPSNCLSGSYSRLEMIRAAEAPPGVAAVLRALDGMNQGAARASSSHRHAFDRLAFSTISLGAAAVATIALAAAIWARGRAATQARYR